MSYMQFTVKGNHLSDALDAAIEWNVQQIMHHHDNGMSLLKAYRMAKKASALGPKSWAIIRDRLRRYLL